MQVLRTRVQWDQTYSRELSSCISLRGRTKMHPGHDGAHYVSQLTEFLLRSYADADVAAEVPGEERGRSRSPAPRSPALPVWARLWLRRPSVQRTVRSDQRGVPVSLPYCTYGAQTNELCRISWSSAPPVLNLSCSQ